MVAAVLAATLALVTASVSHTAVATPPPPPPLPEGWSGDVIVKFAPDSPSVADGSRRGEVLRAAGRRAGLTRTPGDKRGLANQARLVSAAGDPQGLVKALSQRPDVLYAVPDRIITRASDDPYWTNQWNLHDTVAGLGVEKAWGRTTGAGQRVAVIDTGRTAHPDLTGRWVGGHDFVSDVDAAGDGGGRDADPTDAGDFCDVEPSSWHGTSVAGTIAAVAGNRVGVAGVAPGAQVVPVRVLGRCGGTVSDLVDAMVWAAGGAVAGVPTNAHPAKVLNLSLTSPVGGSCSPALQDAITMVRARGALVVVAAGNSSAPAANHEPGNCQGVFTVAASTVTGARAEYSNYGPPVALAAPGGDQARGVPALGVNSGTVNYGSYGVSEVSGTSTAAPHVAGVAALLWAASPGLTLAQVEAVLRAAAEPAAVCLDCGAGVLDARRALELVPALSSAGFGQIGLDGGPIELVGAGLGRVARVRIRGVDAPVIGRSGDTRLVVTAPAHLSPGNYPVTLDNSVVTVRASVGMRYVDLPRVTGLSAAAAAAGSAITVTGTGFLPGSTVAVGEAPATVLAVTPTTVQVRVPAGVAGARAIVRVTTARGVSSASKGSIFTWR